MASGSVVQVEIAASFGQFQTALVAANQAMKEMVAGMKGSMGELPSAIKPAEHATDGLFGAMKDLRLEARQHDRVFNYYGQQMASLTGVTKGFGSEVIGLGIALGSGMWMVAAVEGIKMIVSLFRESGEEAKKAAEKVEKAWVASMDGIEAKIKGLKEQILSLQGVDPAYRAMQTDLLEQAKKVGVLRAENLKSGGLKWEELDKEKKKYDELLKAMKEYRTLTGEKKSIETEQKTEKENDAAKEKAAKALNAALLKLDSEQRGTIEAADREAEKFDEKVAAESLKRETELFAALWKLETQLAENREKLAEKAKQERTRMAHEWMQVGATIGESVGKAFADVIKGTKSVGAAMASLAGSVVSTVIDMVKKIVMANAVSAAAEAASSQAGIPVVGPILAASAMIAMLSMVQGLMGSIPSAAGGWEVTQDSLAMVHKDEKILPADKSKALDDLLANGGGRTPIVINLSTIDTKSTRRFLLDNDAALAEAIDQAVRKGRLG